MSIKAKIVVVLSISILFAISSPAQQLTWDPLGHNGGAGIGNWDTNAANAVWYNGATDVAWPQTSTTVGLAGAIFNGPDAADGTYVVTVDAGQVAVTNLVVNNSGYTFTGGNAIYLGSSDTLSVAANKTVTFNCNLAGSGTSPFWILGSGATMNVGGNLTSGQQVRLAGAAGGAFNLSGSASAPAIMFILSTVNVTNGSLIPSASFYIGYSQTINGTSYSTGVLNVSGSSTVVTINGNILIIGRSSGSGTLNLSGGTFTVGNTTANRNLAINYDSSGNSSAVVNVSGGTLNVGGPNQIANAIDFFDTASAGAGSGATATLIQTNGTVFAWGGVVFGAASGSFSGGTASYTNTGGAIYIGSKGIVLNPAYPTNINIFFSGGTVGALANWSSPMPMTLGTINGNTTFTCADNSGNPYNIALSGALTGAGGMYVTGSGTLTLSGSNNYTGTTVVSNGTLAIVTTASPTNGPVTLDGSTGSPVVSVQSAAPGQFWSTGALTYNSGAPTADFQFGSLTPSAAVAPLQVNGNVVFTVTPNVTIEGSALSTGTYPLIQYTGAVSGTPPKTAALPGYASGYITNITASKVIALVVTSSTYTPAFTWAAGNGAWDTSTLNWKFLGVTTNYSDGDAVLFDDTASGTSPITVTLNTNVNPSGVTANNTTKKYVLTGPGSITGAGKLQVLGGGTVTLTGANTYTGGTVVTAGQLNINNGGNADATAIGTGPLTLNTGAALDNTSSSNVTLQAANQEAWTGNITYVGSSNNLNTGGGGVTLNGNVTLGVSSNDLTIGGAISDNGANYQLTKTGNGALTLPVPNSFGGGLTLSSGLLNIGNPLVMGPGTFTINGGAIDNITGASLELGALSYIWSSSFSFLGSTNLDLGSGTIVDSAGPLTVTVVSNTLNTEGNITSGNYIITKAGNGTWVLAGASSVANQLQLVVNAGQVDMAKSTGQTIAAGSSGLTVQSNALVFDSSSFQIHSGTSTTPVPVSLNGGIYDLNGFNENMDKLAISGNGVLRNGAPASTSTLHLISGYMAQLTGTNCQINVAAPDGNFVFNGSIAGTGTLIKTGLGALKFLSNNVYTGNTVISTGNIALVGAGSISSQASIYLAAANTALDLSASTNLNANGNPILTLTPGQTLSGFGVVTGLVQAVSGSIVSPGSASTTGILTITGYNDTNILNGITSMKLNKGSLTNDQLSVSGVLVYGGTLTVTNLSGSLSPGDSFKLFNAPGGYTGAFSSVSPSRPGYPGFGLAWNTNNLSVNGSLAIVAATVPHPPKIIGVSLSGTTLSIQGSNGVPNEAFTVLETTNLLTPLNGWVPIQTNAFDSSGNFNLSLGTTNAPQQFYSILMQ
jgi:autotransporter-associated beta strand protein